MNLNAYCKALSKRDNSPVASGASLCCSSMINLVNVTKSVSIGVLESDILVAGVDRCANYCFYLCVQCTTRLSVEGSKKKQSNSIGTGKKKKKKGTQTKQHLLLLSCPRPPPSSLPCLPWTLPGPESSPYVFPPPASLLTPQQCFSFLHAGVFSLVSSRPGTSAKTPGLFHCPRQAENGKRVTLPGKKNRPRSSPSGHVAWLLAWSGYTVPAPACETDKEGCVSVWLFGDIQERRHVKEETADGGYS